MVFKRICNVQSCRYRVTPPVHGLTLLVAQSFVTIALEIITCNGQRMATLIAQGEIVTTLKVFI